MSRIVRSARALRDLDAIWDYIAANDARAADRHIARIDKAFAFLAETTGAGVPRPEVGRGCRSFVVGRHLIFYRPIAGGVRIVRVLDGARDMARAFR